jgi:4-amino-4-deoxy-L-arabinose transferase-like glycosyltransferase
MTLLGFCTFLFMFGLDAFGLVGADEPRYAQVAREMLDRHDWITPVLYGAPWLEKPVLYYWGAILAYKLFGVSDWAARLPAAISATVMVGIVYVFFRRFRPSLQLDAALITASSAAIIGFARGASTDMPLAAAFVIAMLGWLGWHRSGSRTWLAIFYIFLALATLAKGPVAVLLAGLIIMMFAFFQQEARIVLRSLWLPGIALFLGLALPWYIAVQVRNPEFVRIFILQNNLARFGTNLYRHEQPFWYFLPVVLSGLLPWTVLVMAAFDDTVRRTLREGKASLRSEQETDLFFILWTTVPIVFFSLSRAKLPGYVLPAIPAATMLLASYLGRKMGNSQQLHIGWTVPHAAAAALVLVPALLIQYLVLNRPVPPAARFTAFATTAVGFVAIFLTLRFRGFRSLRFVTLVPIILGVAIIIRLGSPAIDRALSARPLANELETIESRRFALGIYHVPRQTEFGLAFYRNQPVSSYDRGQIPAGEHLLVAKRGSESELFHLLAGRRLSRLGALEEQHLEYFWVAGAAVADHHNR